MKDNALRIYTVTTFSSDADKFCGWCCNSISAKSQRHNNMLGIIAAVAQVYYFLHESAVCRFRATVVFSVYHG